MKTRKLFYLILLFVGVVFTTQVNASFEKAKSLYQAGKFQSAFEAFHAMAVIGDPSSQFNLGQMYLRGEHVRKDPIKAYAWTFVASEGSSDSTHKATANEIMEGLSKEDQADAKRESEEILSEYGPDALNENLFPRPLSDEECEADPVAVTKKAPNYPRGELRRGRMGSTILEYTISKEGYVRDLMSNYSTSKDFTRTSVKAARAFRYEPYLEDGKPEPVYGHLNRFTYSIVDAKLSSKRARIEIDRLRKEAEDGDPISQYNYALTISILRSFKEHLKEIDFEHQESNDWYLKSAKKGLPHAQFQLGRNMLLGRGCEVSLDGGMKWINTAAIGGFSPAQHYIAQSLVDERTASDKSALAWLENAVLADYYPSKLLLAWELSTSQDEALGGGKAALELLTGEPDNYYDEVRVLETEAAALAANGQFEKAIDKQKNALKKAKKLDWEIPVMGKRLAFYESGKSWQGEYFE
ncbi:MAG: hypothetical protein GY732_07565 [Gammaproteobacteria bacterium]|nr:hypothetical protein [Gammaproteobacteria bacterium]